METFLYNIVGYTSEQVQCQDAGRPADYRTSYSGLFLNEAEHGVPLMIPIKSVGDSTMWDLLTRARVAAATDWVTYFGREAKKLQNKVLNNKNIQIGRSSKTRTYGLKTFNGLVMQPKVYKGLIYVLEQAEVELDKAANITLKITADGSTVHTDTIAGSLGKNNLLTSPLKINLFDQYNNKKDLAAYYSVDNDAKGYNNKVHCGCTGKKDAWASVFDAEGFTTDTEADIYNNVSNLQNRSFGLRLFGHIQCTNTEWLSKVPNTYWTENDYGRLIAKSFQLAWSLKTIAEILNATSINRYTLLKREALYGKRNHFRKLYSELMPVIAQSLPDFLSHCYQCTDHYGFHKTSL